MQSKKFQLKKVSIEIDVLYLEYNLKNQKLEAKEMFYLKSKVCMKIFLQKAKRNMLFLWLFQICF